MILEMFLSMTIIMNLLFIVAKLIVICCHSIIGTLIRYVLLLCYVGCLIFFSARLFLSSMLYMQNEYWAQYKFVNFKDMIENHDDV